MIDAASGLAALHNKGILHGDINLPNLFRTRKGEMKLIDFGKSYRIDEEWLYPNGALFASYYAAPEICFFIATMARTITAPGFPADIWSLGCVGFELLSGAFFQGEEYLPFNISATFNPFPDVRERNPSVPAGIAEIISRCTQRDPSLRYQNGTELLEALRVVKASL